MGGTVKLVSFLNVTVFPYVRMFPTQSEGNTEGPIPTHEGVAVVGRTVEHRMPMMRVRTNSLYSKIHTERTEKHQRRVNRYL